MKLSNGFAHLKHKNAPNLGKVTQSKAASRSLSTNSFNPIAELTKNLQLAKATIPEEDDSIYRSNSNLNMFENERIKARSRKKMGATAGCKIKSNPVTDRFFPCKIKTGENFHNNSIDTNQVKASQQAKSSNKLVENQPKIKPDRVGYESMDYKHKYLNLEKELNDKISEMKKMKNKVVVLHSKINELDNTNSINILTNTKSKI